MGAAAQLDEGRGDGEAAEQRALGDRGNLAEGAGAAPLAALLQEGERMRGKRVGLILCGGNIDLALARRVLSEDYDRAGPDA